MKKGIGIILEGGGVKGAYHVGALKAIQEKKIRMVGSEQEQAELAMIFDANNQYFRKIGHPEFVHSEPEKAAVVEKPVVKAEPKKRFCIVAGQLKQFLKRPNPDKGL